MKGSSEENLKIYTLWHENCIDCDYPLKMYREQGEDYLLECMMNLYTTTAELSIARCVVEVFKKLDPSGTSDMVLPLPAGQSAKKCLSKLKEQLELQEELGGASPEFPRIPVKEDQIPLLLTTISQWMTEQQKLQTAYESEFKFHRDFVKRELRNVFKKLEFIAASVGQDAFAKEISTCFYDVNGPPLQILYGKRVEVDQNKMRNSPEMLSLSPCAFLFLHLSQREEEKE